MNRLFWRRTFWCELECCRRGLLKCAALMLCLVTSSCSDIVTKNYATRSAAEADLLFDKGWLPSIIPQSSTRILVRSDLDRNQSEGNFYFEPSDLQDFTKKLANYEISNGNASVLGMQEKLREGYVPYTYISGGSRWIFLVNPKQGHVVFAMQDA